MRALQYLRRNEPQLHDQIAAFYETSSLDKQLALTSAELQAQGQALYAELLGASS